MKTCKKCGLEKPTSDYTVDVRYKDGYYPWCADCRRAWRAARRHGADREKTLEYFREYAAERRPRIRKLALATFYRHKEEYSAKRREYDRKRYQTDPEVRRRKNQQASEKNRRRRAKLYGIETQHHTEQEWQELCVRYDHRCLCCGERKPLSRDHVVPVTMGGTDSIDNIQPLCKVCNSRKNNRTIDYRPGESA
jgi:5-methylcytosine-specific restriction endonuclease McrA